MNLEEMKALMSAMAEKGVKKLEVKDEKGFEIKLEREEVWAPQESRSDEGLVAAKPVVQRREGLPKEMGVEAELKGEGAYITSPMVGTFYGGASPEAGPFVQVGDLVDEGTVVCIIEAMKVMNEVKAGKKGKIASVLIRNANPVDFGTKLFEIVEVG